MHVIASFQYHISVLLNMASAAPATGGYEAEFVKPLKKSRVSHLLACSQRSSTDSVRSPHVQKLRGQNHKVIKT